MIKDMTDPELHAYYWQLRRAIDNSGRLGAACTTRTGRQRAARGMDTNLRHLDICSAVARRRGLDLLAPLPA